MLLSMTGFSSRSVRLNVGDDKQINCSIELKAINTRFFEAICKLPSALSSLEVKIINLLHHKMLRGRVYVAIRFTGESEVFGHVMPSLKIVKEYLAGVDLIKEQCDVQGSITMSDLLSLPNVMVLEKGVVGDQAQAALLTIIDQIADDLMITRQEEGVGLLKDLKARFEICAQKIVEIEKKSQQLIESLRKELERIKQEYDLSEEDVQLKIQLDEKYGLLNKIDIHEEVIRFKSHLDSVETLLNNDEKCKGKRLDFILQELLREINTTMAKCSNFDISSLGVDIKVELEKAREQVQNIV